MMSKYLLLYLIPVLVDARISISITAGQTEAEASVKFSGSDVQIISDQERETFKIYDRGLKEACRIFSGVTPTDVFVKSPTPWTDVYLSMKWQQVQRILKPVNARIVDIQKNPVLISTREFENNSPVRAKYNTAISQDIQETVSHSWSEGGQLTVGQAIAYDVNCAAGEVIGNNNLSYEESWGNEITKVKSVKLGTTTSVEVELNPGQAVVAELTATQGTLDIEVDYEATLTGMVFANYDEEFRGYHWWGFPIEYLLKDAGLPTVVRSTEKISVGFYTSAKVEVKEKATENSVKIVPARIIFPESSEEDEFSQTPEENLVGVVSTQSPGDEIVFRP